MVENKIKTLAEILAQAIQRLLATGTPIRQN